MIAFAAMVLQRNTFGIAALQAWRAVQRRCIVTVAICVRPRTAPTSISTLVKPIRRGPNCWRDGPSPILVGYWRSRGGRTLAMGANREVGKA